MKSEAYHTGQKIILNKEFLFFTLKKEYTVGKFSWDQTYIVVNDDDRPIKLSAYALDTYFITVEENRKRKIEEILADN